MSFPIAPLPGAPARDIVCRWVITSLMSLLVACGSQAVEHAPPPEPISSNAREIVGGVNTTIDDNPWQVFLKDAQGRAFCSGSILDERWILTAAHCLYDDDGNYELPYLVVAGRTHQSETSQGQARLVYDAIPYPAYSPLRKDKDVALLYLTTPLDFSTPTVKPISIATDVDESSRVMAPGVVARAAGWGRVSDGGIFSDTLRAADLIIQSNSAAQAAYTHDIITTDQLAAASLGKGICSGDSGGPLTVPYGDSRVLVGVTSWAAGCGDSRYPSMFARVSWFEPWITATTRILSPEGTRPVISLSTGQWSHTYTLSVPAGASHLTFELSEGTGNSAVYARLGAVPTQAVNHCDPQPSGNAKKCTVATPYAGTYYVKVFALSNTVNVRLKAGYHTPLDFGGMWGYVDGGRLVPHPGTGSDTCPVGYKPTRLLGSEHEPGVDWDVFLCTRPRKADREPLYDFGGMWGYVLGTLIPNPYTFQNSCPTGYTEQRVLGEFNVDYDVYVCYKLHEPRTASDFPFGGMMGQVNNGKVAPNPATGAASCPFGFVNRPVSGYPSVDWTLQFCYEPPTRWDFGGMWGFVDHGVSVPNPATGFTSCPLGYKSTQLLGTPGVDWPVFLCSRPALTGSGNSQALDFGGMYSRNKRTAPTIEKPNPYTGGQSCPPGYAATRILGSAGLDAELFLCHKLRMSKSPPEYPFGGMWGQVNGGTYVPNPSTGAISCPSGYTAKDMLGISGLDYQLAFCSAMN